MKLIEPRNIVQVAYYVQEFEASARHFHKLTGAGPFFIYNNVPIVDCTHRGEPTKLDHSSAYGQWGSIMVEFAQQNDDGPSAFRDMYGDGKEGIHHVALFVKSVAEETIRFKILGIDLTDHYWTADRVVEVAFIDTTAVLGHMLELYEPVEKLLKFYEFVKASPNDWDGEELFSYLN